MPKLTPEELKEFVCQDQREADLRDTIDALESELAEAKTLMECGHPKTCGAIRKLALSEIPGIFLNDGITEASEGYCTLCADLTAAYERGLRDAAEMAWQVYTNYEGDGCADASHIKEAILALKDRGAKGV